MKNRLQKFIEENPMVKKVIGIILIIIGLISIVTPFTPVGFLLVVGMEILGIRVFFWDSLKKWFGK